MSEVKIPRCWICFDEGLITYKKKTGSKEAEYAARCICISGKPYKSTLPAISEVADQFEMAEENFKKWWQENKDKEGVREAMRDKGLYIPEEEEAKA